MLGAKDRLPEDAAASPRRGAPAAPARINSNLRRESRKPPFVFSSLHTLLSAQKLQRPYFHSLPHSLQQERKLTPAFPITPGLFLRSLTQERKSTPLFSCACARFREYVGVAAKAERKRPVRPSFHGNQLGRSFSDKQVGPPIFSNCRRPSAVAYSPSARLTPGGDSIHVQPA
jgi:hypothetical protein